ncbi:unnamed protein product [Paramecium sonneborni]|uniref:Peptidase C51 domain-containing protein n=1 Tax=Paramecium sonneborni TaxID=65129 RepID=A0A8S1QY65_9CILI|nr:unnamed protein product [Paramecium sonneborni]CAD8120712.1 unnamed protein product [Paramecium sonneborni]
MRQYNKKQWGSVLGEAHNVKAYSNVGIHYDHSKWNSYKSFLKKEESGLMRDVLLGVKYQCVEYARRFIVTNFAAAFKEINCADQIYQLNNVDDLTTLNGTLQFSTFPNKSNSAPQIGDLIIYPRTQKQPYGHVAVIVEVGNGYVCVAEQNYEDSGWTKNNYSRKLKMNQTNGQYEITQVRVGLEHQYQYWWDRNEVILGWKRVCR